MVPDPLRMPRTRHGLALLLGLSLAIYAAEMWVHSFDPHTPITGYFWVPLLLVPWIGRTADLLPLAVIDLALTLWIVLHATDVALQVWFEQTPLRAAIFLLILWLNQLRFRYGENVRLLEAIERVAEYARQRHVESRRVVEQELDEPT